MIPTTENYNDTIKRYKKWFTFSNISTALLAIFMLAILFSPDVKGLVIQGLMKVGLFQPDISEKAQENSVPIQQASAKQVSFTDVKGKTINLSDQKGKVVFMNFWATWCPPCIAEMPAINSLYSKYKDNKNVVFIMVDVDSKIDASTEFMKKRHFSLPVYIPASEMPEDYFSGSMPTTVILDKAGNIAFHHLGGADYANPEVSAFIDKLAK
ncbi:TlpA disulfide reductase family protein [Pedobacter sp. MC2016-24]|uniref:TlpA family protein disulfide reductase n=1 Tax=Pedobacter sp. MC2016-24 TaxID=2780090 RepID=UPI00188285A8|nr:TlpA disulfide reductase family protein [Pedobacter sp. MC2016-24]MBE9601512.1 TlpA family protein disulfide reductase [Pedobacter sp. MC2016-24]